MISYSGIELNEEMEHSATPEEGGDRPECKASPQDCKYLPSHSSNPPVVEPYDHNKNLWAILSGVITSPKSNDSR